jgi:hypothetical protein
MEVVIKLNLQTLERFLSDLATLDFAILEDQVDTNMKYLISKALIRCWQPIIMGLIFVYYFRQAYLMHRFEFRRHCIPLIAYTSLIVILGFVSCGFSFKARSSSRLMKPFISILKGNSNCRGFFNVVAGGN